MGWRNYRVLRGGGYGLLHPPLTQNVGQTPCLQERLKMDVKEQLKSKSLSELFMLIRNGSGAMALSASEEIERRLSAQQKREPDVPKYPPVCTCSMDDGIHEWNCALEKARRLR